MAGGIRVLVSKEVKELLRDPKIFLVMILVPSLMFIVLGESVGYATEKTFQQVLKGVSIAFVDADGGWASDLLYSIAKSAPGAVVERVEASGGEARELALGLAVEGRFEIVILVPRGFTENLTTAKPTFVEVYSVMRSLSIASSVKPEIVKGLMEQYRERLVKRWLAQAFPDKDPDVLFQPFEVRSEAIVMGRPVPEEAVAALLGQSFILFFGPFLLLSISASIAAASIGVEKEEKTLETLLSLPVKRRDILFSKAIATLLVALVGTVSLTLGIAYYMYRITHATVAAVPLDGEGEAAPGLQQFGLGDLVGLLGSGAILATFAGIFVSITLVLISSIVVSSLASNVREAQALAGYLWLPLFIPLIVLMLINLGSLGSVGKLAVALLPFATPLVAIKAAFEGLMWMAYANLAANLAYTAIVLYLGARWFEGERILASRLPRGRGLRLGTALARRR